MNERRIIQTGIDVSRYQGKIDWARVKAGGTGFAIIKCTQGVNTVDPEFHRNMRNCAAIGLPVGAYVYSRARTAFAAAEEAERAAEECAPYHLDYPIAMDFEAAQFLAMPKKTRGAIIDAFCTRIEARGYNTGFRLLFLPKRPAAGTFGLLSTHQGRLIPEISPCGSAARERWTALQAEWTSISVTAIMLTKARIALFLHSQAR